MSLPIFLYLVRALILVAHLARADVRFADETDICHFVNTEGIATCCCNGDCGSGPVPSGDWIWGAGCPDYPGGAVCSQTQIYHSTNESTKFIAGDSCWGKACSWEKWRYKYKCCDCPGGYRSTTQQDPNCDATPSCVGCSDAWETPFRTGTSRYSWGCRPKGLECDSVDTMARNYDIAQKNGPNAVGYYGQLLNLVCLRSNCTKVKACERVQGVRMLTGDECQSLNGEFDFENTVFGETAKGSDEASVAAAAKEADEVGEKLARAFEGVSVIAGSQNPLLRAVIVASGATDPSSWGTLYAGVSHFGFDLFPHFLSYIHNLVKSNPDDDQLRTRLKRLTAEHKRFFRCAVTPGFLVQALRGEVLPIPALIGNLLVPIAATILRMSLVVTELLLANRLPSYLTSALLAEFGIRLPRNEKLRWNPRNWSFDGAGMEKPATDKLLRRDGTGDELGDGLGFAPSFAATSLTELSDEAGNPNPAISLSIHDSTKGLQTNFTVQIIGRDETTADPIMARTSLVDLTSTSQPLPLKYPIGWTTPDNKTLKLVSPVGTIYPATADIVPWNATHVLPGNITGSPIPLGEYLEKGQGENAGLGSYRLFEHATIRFSFSQASLDLLLGIEGVEDAARDLVLYDLVSGLALTEGSVFRVLTSVEEGGSGGGVFEVDVVGGRGSWEGGLWGGGGCFAVGLVGDGGKKDSEASGVVRVGSGGVFGWGMGMVLGMGVEVLLV